MNSNQSVENLPSTKQPSKSLIVSGQSYVLTWLGVVISYLVKYQFHVVPISMFLNLLTIGIKQIFSRYISYFPYCDLIKSTLEKRGVYCSLQFKGMQPVMEGKRGCRKVRQLVT